MDRSVVETWKLSTVKDGIVRWGSNDRVPFGDILDGFLNAGLIDQATRDRSNDARDAEAAAFLAAYRANQQDPTDEELFEMRAAFGPGVTVVDVVTGRQIQL